MNKHIKLALIVLKYIYFDPCLFFVPVSAAAVLRSSNIVKYASFGINTFLQTSYFFVKLSFKFIFKGLCHHVLVATEELMSKPHKHV